MELLLLIPRLSVPDRQKRQSKATVFPVVLVAAIIDPVVTVVDHPRRSVANDECLLPLQNLEEVTEVDRIVDPEYRKVHRIAGWRALLDEERKRNLPPKRVWEMRYSRRLISCQIGQLEAVGEMLIMLKIKFFI